MNAPTSLLDVLSLTSTGEDTFTAPHLPSTSGVVFGGQLLAQMLTAAASANPGQQVKSMHCVFARGASPEWPLDLRVTTHRLGRSFSSIGVEVSQRDRPCTQALVLLHTPDPDLIRHQATMPVTEGPSNVPRKVTASGWEIGVCGGVDIQDPDAVGAAEVNVWSRFPGGPHDLVTSQACLAYASDGFLIGTAMRPHSGVGQSMAHVSISTSVITQTLTFHHAFDAGDWHLLAHESPAAGQGRSFGRAHAFTADGLLVASFSQENMIREFRRGEAPEPGTTAKF
jgi:acyl-CoA thioesterase-2